MDETRYGIREFRVPDYGDLARIAAELDDTHRASPEEYQRATEAYFVPPCVMLRLVAEERATGRSVGFGTLNNDPESFDPETFWVTIEVDRAYQGKGIGKALAAALDGAAARRHARRLWTSTRADNGRAVRFFVQQGYAERRRKWTARLTVSRALEPRNRARELASSGISFLTAAELNLEDPQVQRELHELSNLTSADEPRMAPYTPVTLEQFILMDFKGPGFAPEAYFLARADGKFIATSSVRRIPTEPGSLRQGWTGTLREYRNRGIATELKRRVLEYARSHGFRDILTGNDSLNQPMLAINRSFGYERVAERIEGERSLQSVY